MRATGFVSCAAFSLVLGAPFVGCADFNAVRQTPPRGTVGEELYGILCDRVSAQAIREDMNGASFTAICHKRADGTYADEVDESKLPALDPNGKDVKGNPVAIETQKTARQRQLGRIHALVRHRAALIGAFDSTFPDIRIPVVDERNPDLARSCDPIADAGDRGKLTQQLSDMLGKLIDLYEDGTIPRTTQAMAHIMDDIQASPAARTALARFEARQGYKSESTAMGALRVVLAYPRLRDLANASLRLLSADSDPYAENAPRDGSGRRIPVAGPAHPAFAKLLEVAHEELRTFAPDPRPPALTSSLDAAGRPVMSRPRSTLEIVQRLVQLQDPAYAQGDAPLYLVLRDERGIARVPMVGGALPAPFTDPLKIGLPAIDDLGQFVTLDGTRAPSPFPSMSGANALFRDPFGRALTAPEGQPLYETIDTSQTFANALFKNLPPLLDPDPAKKHETLMDALAGLEILLGTRDGASRQYPPVTVQYDAYRREDAGLVDLVWGAGALLGDPTGDDFLALAHELLTKRLSDVARLTGTGLALDAMADRHPGARIPKTSTLWDEVLDVLVQIQKVPGLLEDVLRALTDERTVALGETLANYMRFTDEISYDRDHINASYYNGGVPYNVTTKKAEPPRTPVDRTRADSAYNRSMFQRVAQIVADADGVAVCSKENGQLHGVVLGLEIPPIPTGKECSFAKIDNLAVAFVQSIVGKANLYIRNDLARALGTVALIEDSSDLTGFWDGRTSTRLRPRPEMATRMLFFDPADSPNRGDKNFRTNRFLRGLFDLRQGTTVCPERIIPDPCNAANKASNGCGNAPTEILEVAEDGNVHGLRSCPAGDSLYERDNNTLFVSEHFDFYNRIQPLILPFVNRGKEQLFVKLLGAFHRHWQTDRGTIQECSADPKNLHFCTRDGASSYEPLLIEQFTSDLFPTLRDTIKVVAGITVPRCTAVDPKTRACTRTQTVDGVTVLADGLRALTDPDRAKALGVKNRDGSAQGLRNDGARTPQVTPLYLILQALNRFDESFAAWAGKHPNDDRLAPWRRARSQLVDQLLTVDGTGAASSFRNPITPVLLTQMLQLLREQLVANCPGTFTVGGQERCTWATQEMARKLGETTSGPLFGSIVDVLSALREDAAGRAELEKLLLYMMDPKSPNDARSTMLATVVDFPQLLADDDMGPLLRTLSGAAAASQVDERGNVVRMGAVDATTALLARLSGRAYGADGVEHCGRELDPNQVLTLAMQKLVAPMPRTDGRPAQTPLDVILDAIAEVNRVVPDDPSKLRADDYASITRNVSEFLADKERGLEQFYEIIRQGARPR